MENPRLVQRCVQGLLLGILLVAIFWSLIIREALPALIGLTVVVGFVAVCAMGVLLNRAIFPPLFRLVSKLGSRQPTSKQGKSLRRASVE